VFAFLVSGAALDAPDKFFDRFSHVTRRERFRDLDLSDCWDPQVFEWPRPGRIENRIDFALGAYSQTVKAGGLTEPDDLSRGLSKIGARAVRWTEICATHWSDDEPELIAGFLSRLAQARCEPGYEPVVLLSLKLSGDGAPRAKDKGARKSNAEILARVERWLGPNDPGIRLERLEPLGLVDELHVRTWARQSLPQERYDRDRAEEVAGVRFGAGSKRPMKAAAPLLLEVMQAADRQTGHSFG
jgi:hypothetical protein